MKVNMYNRFIERAKQLHGERYDYSKVEYVNAHTKVCIICPEHGEFWCTPNSHLNGSGCPTCSSNKKLTTEIFIERAKQLHGERYDYSKVEYVNAHTKVCIICPEHGEFWCTPANHLRERGCPLCRERKHLKYRYTSLEKRPKQKLTLENFIKKCREIYGDKYDYSKVEYVNNKTKVCIICPEHGEFWIRPDKFLCGKSCKRCSEIKRIKNRKITQDEWIRTAQILHNNRYDYSKVEYVNAQTKVCIICPEHGEFWQKPSSHLQNRGCPICQESKLEKEIKQFLDNENINYFYNYHPQWLKKLELDFYLPNFKIGIECQGIQHFEPVKHFGGEKRFIKLLKNDLEKKKLCQNNGVKLLLYSNIKKENIITKIEILKKEIYENRTNN